VTEPGALFPFVQLEFGWPLGPDDGRYAVRDAPEGPVGHVVVLETLGAQRRGLLARQRTRQAEAQPEPEAVPTGRATVVLSAHPLADAPAAGSWLDARRGVDEAEAEVAAAVRVLNRALEAHRLAAADPFVHEVSATQALAVRLGYGRGEQVAEGRWTAAIVVPAPRAGRRRRAAALRPQERVAAVLAGRDRPLACEELALRARLDLDHGREREAALGLRVALEAALVELADAEVEGMTDRLEELRSRRHDVGDAANAALHGALGEPQREAVTATLDRLAAALRARTAAAGSG
jgi:hypothetical protein